MAISFVSIPLNIRVPGVYVEFDNSQAVQGLSDQPYTALVVGQRLSTGTVAQNIPTKITSIDQGDLYFGAGSQVSLMIKAFFRNNGFTELWAVGLDDLLAGTAATGTITLTGTATSAGTLNLRIGGRAVPVAVSVGQTNTALATAVAAAITADTQLPVTASVASNVVTMTARNKGLVANSIDARLNYYDGEVTPTGITAAIVQLAGGTGNPDISPLWAAIGDQSFNIIAHPYTDAANLTSIETELASRFGPLRQIEAQAITGATGSFATLSTLGGTRNSPFNTIVGTPSMPTPPYEVAAAVAAVVAYYAKTDAGSVARPFTTLPLVGVLAPANKNRFTFQESNLLLYAGISTLVVDAGSVVRVQRLVTTYRTSPAGAADVSYLDLNTMLTLGYLRYDFRNYILRKYPRHKLGNDGTRYGDGQAIMTPNVGRAEAINRFRLWEEQALVEGAAQFKASLIVERNATDVNRLDFKLRPDLVNGFLVCGVQIQFLL